PLKAHVPDVEAAAPINVRAFDEVVLIGVIADGPDETRGGSFGARFGAELHRPATALLVFNDDLFRRVGRRSLAADELESADRVGRTVAAADAVVQVAAL